MKRRVGITLGALAVLVSLTACNEYNPAEDPEQIRYDKCVDAGGSYASEDTSAGNKWTCTVDGEQATIHDEN